MDKSSDEYSIIKTKNLVNSHIQNEDSIDKYFLPLNYGLQDDIPYDEYFNLPAINCSAIKYCFRSPYHMDKFLKGDLRETKAEFDFGIQFHKMIFEPDKFDDTTYIMPEIGPDGESWDMRKKAHKEAKREHDELADGKEKVSFSDYEKMWAMRDSVNNHAIASKIIKMNGFNEKTILWKNRDTGINLKGKLDKYVPKQFIVDLKTTKDASPYGFVKDFEKYLYKVQAAIYTDAIMTIEGEELPFVFIAVEKFPPYFCKVYEISQEKINEGRVMYVSKLQEFIDFKRKKLDISDIHVI